MTNKDGKRTVSVFMDEKLVQILKSIAQQSNRSFSYVVVFMIDRGLRAYAESNNEDNGKEETEDQEQKQQ